MCSSSCTSGSLSRHDGSVVVVRSRHQSPLEPCFPLKFNNNCLFEQQRLILDRISDRRDKSGSHDGTSVSWKGLQADRRRTEATESRRGGESRRNSMWSADALGRINPFSFMNVVLSRRSSKPTRKRRVGFRSSPVRVKENVATARIW